MSTPLSQTPYATKLTPERQKKFRLLNLDMEYYYPCPEILKPDLVYQTRLFWIHPLILIDYSYLETTWVITDKKYGIAVRDYNAPRENVIILANTLDALGQTYKKAIDNLLNGNFNSQEIRVINLAISEWEAKYNDHQIC